VSTHLDLFQETSAAAKGKGRSSRPYPRLLPNHDTSNASVTYGLQNPLLQVKSPQHELLEVQEKPFAPQQVVSLLPALEATEQIMFVSFVQHCWLVVHGWPKSSDSHFGHFLHFFFFAATSPATAENPIAAAAAAAAPPSAERSVVLRVLPRLTSRRSESNCEPSKAYSYPDGAPRAVRFQPRTGRWRPTRHLCQTGTLLARWDRHG
jgi:hypothetical protein